MRERRGARLSWVMRAAFLILLASLVSSAGAATTPEGLSVPAQAAISAVLGHDNRAYHAVPHGQGVQFANPRHRLAVTLTPAGVQIQRGGAHWGLAWQGYGYGVASPPGPAVAPSAHANRVEYRRGAVTEWYVNGPRGLQQGFTLSAPPTPRTDGPLTLALSLSGTLQARPDPGGAGLSLTRGDGQVVLAYRGLTAWDVTGRALPARLQLHGAELRLEIEDTGAQYPLVVDPFVEQAKLTASDGAAFDFFGDSVAISGDTVVVGARNDDIGANSDQGSAYVFVKPLGGWATMPESAKLTASDGAGSDHFGVSVAISGDTVVVGAAHNDIGANIDQGSAYVFVKPLGGWATMTESAKVTASDGGAFEEFGISVAISGDTVVVGAVTDDIGANFNQGSAYVFVKPLGGWATMPESAKLTASDGAAGDQFGVSVAISGDTVVAGAWLDNIDFADQGSAYVFVKPLGGWATMTESAKLTASDGGDFEEFGISVAISGDTVVVGAVNQTVYVFVKPLGGWATMPESAKLTASDGAAGDQFGVSVAISGDTVVAGAYLDTIDFPNQGSAYVFVKPLGGWATMTESTKLTASDGAAGDQFGLSVAISGDTVVAGAFTQTVGANLNQGSAYVFGSAGDETIVGDFFLHGSGSTANPPTLFLDASAPTAVTPKFKDSSPVNFSGGNPWKEIGTWAADPSLTEGQLTALTDLQVWVGLKNSDDIGTQFDLRAEVYKNDTLIALGETRCITGTTRNSVQAKEVVTPLDLFSPVEFDGVVDVLGLKVLTRIGTNPGGSRCAGPGGSHNSAGGLRLYFDAVSRPSNLEAVTP